MHNDGVACLLLVLQQLARVADNDQRPMEAFVDRDEQEVPGEDVHLLRAAKLDAHCISILGVAKVLQQQHTAMQAMNR